MAHNPSDNPFHNYLPAMVITFIWIIIFVVVIVMWSMRRTSTEDIWGKPIFCDCSDSTAKFIHIFRLIFETPPMHRNLDKHVINFKINDASDKRLVEIKIDGKRLSNYNQFSESEPNKSVVMFLLYTKVSLQSMDSIVINIIFGNPLKVFGVEIQDISDPNCEANVAEVGEEIKKLPKESADKNQNFLIYVKRFRSIEESVSPSRLLTPFEYVLFIWMAFNLIAVFPAIINVCNGEKLLCNDYNYDWISTIYTGLEATLFSSLIFVLLISLYRYLIKYKVEQTFNSWLWWTVLNLFLAFVTLICVASAVVASIIVPNHEHKEAEHFAEYDVSIFWMSSVFIGIAFFILFFLPVLSIFGNCFNFFSKGLQQNLFEVDKKVENVDESKDKATEESEHYLQQLVKSGKKVKSISQY